MDRVKELFLEVQKNYDRILTPLYPRVLVQVLGKEQVVGGIILPETGTGMGNTSQNKPLWEGIVIDVYTPFVKTVKMNGQWVDIKLEPRVKIGDHVLFAHWAGRQVAGLNSNWSFIEEDLIQGILEYQRRPGEPVTARTTSGGERK